MPLSMKNGPSPADNQHASPHTFLSAFVLALSCEPTMHILPPGEPQTLLPPTPSKPHVPKACLRDLPTSLAVLASSALSGE